MRYELVNIKRDPNTSYTREIPEWETPVVAWIFGDEAITRTGKFTSVDRDYPTAESEFDRLTRAYGKDTKSDISHVASVYGQAGAGVRALKQIIDSARKAEEDEAETLLS